MSKAFPVIRFGEKESNWAFDEWKFNCGPAAICAVTGMTPDELRPHMLDFETKGYTNPTLMFGVLRELNIPHRQVFRADEPKPFPFVHGLVRVQWGGPWTKLGVPMQARYWHTHWIAVDGSLGEVKIFDVNAMFVGGWISWRAWNEYLHPALIEELAPKSDGTWWATHGIEILR